MIAKSKKGHFVNHLKVSVDLKNNTRNLSQVGQPATEIKRAEESRAILYIVSLQHFPLTDANFIEQVPTNKSKIFFALRKWNSKRVESAEKTNERTYLLLHLRLGNTTTREM